MPAIHLSRGSRVLALSLLVAAAAATGLTGGNAPGATVGWVASAGAAPRAFTRVDPGIAVALDIGLPAPAWTGSARSMATHVPVMVELGAPADPVSLAHITATGARLWAPSGKPVHHGRFVPVEVDRVALPRLAALTDVVRLTLASPMGRAPLNYTGGLVHVEAARGAHPKFGRLTGKDTVVADLDTALYIYHPHFFHADAGWFDWIDVDGDGRLTPDVDAVDLDRDGKAGPHETARLLRASSVTLFGEDLPARPEGFHPGYDWIYLDTNGNGVRDFSAMGQFDDATPALGEPLFVPDDLDQDGKLRRHERLARLGSSKVRALMVDAEPYAKITKEFTRGVDLAKAIGLYNTAWFTADPPSADHATSVLSIVAGDSALTGRVWKGMAPDADLISVATPAKSAFGATYMAEKVPDVMLHETAMWVFDPLDGSDAHSQVVDAAATDSMISQACPVGNHMGSKRHVRANIGLSEEQKFTFWVPMAMNGQPTTAFYVSLNVRGDGGENLSAWLTPPGGPKLKLPGADTLDDDTVLYTTRMTTPRQTVYFKTQAFVKGKPGRPAGTKAVKSGTWELHLVAPAQATVTVDAYLYDSVAGWGQGVAFDKPDESHLVGVPSVADHCVGIAAAAGHIGTKATSWFGYSTEKVGEVRGYSARGPRIDGVQKPDVGAPDNPFAATIPLDIQGQGFKVSVPEGAMQVFGGTSGAAPHVAGALALLAGTGVRGDAAREALRNGAVALPGAKSPDFNWGWGLMDVAATLGGVPDAVPPVVELHASTDPARVGQQVELIVQAKGPGGQGQLQVRWDDGYDGTWDTEYAPLATRKLVYDTTGVHRFKVRVRNDAGQIGEAALRLEVLEAPAEVDAAAADGAAIQDVVASDVGGAGAGASLVDNGAANDGCTVGGRPARAGGTALVLLIGLALLYRARRRQTARANG